MVSEQVSTELMTGWPVPVQTSGAVELHAGLAVAWSVAGRDLGRSADRLAAARATARAVARVSGCAEDAVALSHRPGSAPTPLRRHNGAIELLPCVVSIAHSGGRAVAAAASTNCARRIGVDLERAGVVSPRQLRLFASASERALGLDPTTLWTLKEAAWKAFSCDASMPFQALTVAAIGTARTPGHIVFALRGEIVPAVACIWHPWPGWLAALVEVA